MTNGRKKGGVKAHTLIRAKDDVPCFVKITEAAASDSTIMASLSLPPGSILVMDKGYRSYIPMAKWTKQKVSWVTRLNARTCWEVKKELPVSQKLKDSGVISDKLIILGNRSRKAKVPLQKARIVVYRDQASGKTFEFLTNNTKLSPLTIAGIYKRRWQIESLFKRIKQNSQLHSFLGDNQNAIQIQVWCTLIADLLTKVVKDRADKRRKTKWSFSNVAGLIRQHLGTYIDLIKFLINPEKALIGYKENVPEYQLTLFKT